MIIAVRVFLRAVPWSRLICIWAPLDLHFSLVDSPKNNMLSQDIQLSESVLTYSTPVRTETTLSEVDIGGLIGVSGCRDVSALHKNCFHRSLGTVRLMGQAAGKFWE